jgi:hypothetical protein
VTALIVLATLWIIVALASAAFSWRRLTRPITAIDYACSRIDLALRQQGR